MISEVEALADHGHRTPFVKYSLVKACSASIDMEHFVDNPYGDELDRSPLGTYSVYKYLPNYHTESYNEISNTPSGTSVTVIVDLTSLS